MKKVNFLAYQEGTSLNLSFEVETLNQSKVLGTLLNELFAWCEVQRSVNAKGLKFSQPINLKFETEKQVFDTGTVNKRLTQKLKMNRTAKSKKAFAQKVKVIFDYSLREVNTVNFSDLIESLSE
jgi:hypothetical protein